MMHRNLNGTNAICRSLLEERASDRKQSDVILSLLLEQREENRKLSSFLKAKIPDMNKYFPIKDNETLARFLDESDGLYPLRRAEFYNMVQNCNHDKKNLFATSLLYTCFSEEYIRNHTWPTNK